MQQDIQILAFGIAREIVGNTHISFPYKEGMDVGQLKLALMETYPSFRALKSFAIAVNATYQQDNFTFSPNDEIVIIPPVSGG